MKLNWITRVIILTLALALSALAGEQDFILVNQTGLTIDQLFCSPTTTQNWEEDVLGVDVLEDEASVHIKFSRSEKACHWDLMIVDEDGDQIVWANINLCETTRITLYYENGEPTAEIETVDAEEEEEEEEDEE